MQNVSAYPADCSLLAVLQTGSEVATHNIKKNCVLNSIHNILGKLCLGFASKLVWCLGSRNVFDGQFYVSLVDRTVKVRFCGTYCVNMINTNLYGVVMCLSRVIISDGSASLRGLFLKCKLHFCKTHTFC